MKHIRNSTLLLASIVLSGCATSWSGSPNGFALIRQDRAPAIATDNSRSPKTGTACAQNVLSVYASGDASIEAAKKNGNISKISYVDYTLENYVVFGKFCTVVHGE
jgi:hypothetical protein